MSNEAVVLTEQEIYRLPTTVIPEYYQIELTPNLTNFTFVGSMSVRIVVKQAVDEIILNASELDIKQAHVSDGKGREIKATISYDQNNERAIFSFPQTINLGDWQLVCNFTGILNDKLHGFYRSSYKDKNGQPKILAATQFEATDARRAFPCFDEPELKAVFKITLIVDSNLTAISNTSIEKEEIIESKNKKAVHFHETIKMSTYLVAFIVGEFVSSAPIMVGKTPIKIWALPDKQHLTKFARECAYAALAFFESYYGIKYPGDKLDLIAIPDFASGAMENLGAVTFRENALLVDESRASHAELERVADVVAHELAHMWFGDLVTMKWWNGLWLNEAFATFMEMLAVDAWKPDWKRWDTFAVSRAAAFSTDGLKSTRAIEFPVKHPDEAGAMFDVLTYEKGASVLRMLEQYLAAEEFRQGIALYLNKHQYKNAETTDLWDALEESSKQPVRQMMDSWIFQEGHPVVSVALDEAATGVYLTQQRFLYMPVESANQTEQLSQKFHIPIMIKAKTDKGITSPKLILNQEQTHLNLGGKLEWIVINEGGHGFYRVCYAPDLLQRLTVVKNNLNVIERFNLVSDTWAACVAGKISLRDYLALANMFADETDKNVWAILIGSLNYLNKVIEPAERQALQTYVKNLLNKQMQRLGWTPKVNEDELTKQLRGMIIGALGTLGNDADLQAQASVLFDKYKQNASEVDPNVLPALVAILSYTGDDKRYEEFFNAYRTAKTPQEEQRYLFSLPNFRKTQLIKQTLTKATNGEVRTQNAPYLVQAVLANTFGRELAWDFLKKNWDEMIQLYPENAIPRMCEGVTNLVSDKLENEVKQFFATHNVKKGGKTIDQHLEKLRVAVMFKQREAKNFSLIFSGQ